MCSQMQKFSDLQDFEKANEIKKLEKVNSKLTKVIKSHEQ